MGLQKLEIQIGLEAFSLPSSEFLIYEFYMSTLKHLKFRTQVSGTCIVRND